jgi:hypothetical protein
MRELVLQDAVVSCPTPPWPWNRADAAVGSALRLSKIPEKCASAAAAAPAAVDSVGMVVVAGNVNDSEVPIHFLLPPTPPPPSSPLAPLPPPLRIVCVNALAFHFLFNSHSRTFWHVFI